MNSIDAKTLQKMFIAGAKTLEAKKEWINELNVFPVPDGDTGTNMTLTILAAAKEVDALEDVNFNNLAKVISSGSLRGARGNSGVILSQLLRGFTKVIKDESEITVSILAEAMVRASETAYKAVIKPKEGTILTVAREMSERATELAEIDSKMDIKKFIEEIIISGDISLDTTPDLLPVLKQAGVVDSGGQGLMQIIKGAYDCLIGKEIDLTLSSVNTGKAASLNAVELNTDNIKFGYCTEFIVNIEKEYNENIEKEFREYLESIGDSLVLVSDEGIIKIHVHTNDPGLAFQKGLLYGQLTNMKVDNMRYQHEEVLIKEADMLKDTKMSDEAKLQELKKYGFIAVAVGEGIGNIFRGIGADCLIEGGQTMNPSTEDMLDAINKVNAETIYILPNNKNIILAAEQAAKLTEDKNIIVVPTTTVPQGITALINFTQDAEIEKNTENMAAEILKVKTGQITYAVRDTVINDMNIKTGDIMGLGDVGLLAVGNDISDTAFKTLAAMVDENTELISLYYGSDVSKEDAEELADKIINEYSNCDVELHSGGQPIYYYVMSVE
jgi:DAK2 domain fusion protein YloV